MNPYKERLRVVAHARDAFTHGAHLLTDPPFTIERVAEAILLAGIALIHLSKADPEEKAKDLAIAALRIEQARRFGSTPR